MPLGVSMALRSTESKTVFNNRGDPVPYWDRVVKFTSMRDSAI
jgi:hypothetical protein